MYAGPAVLSLSNRGVTLFYQHEVLPFLTSSPSTHFLFSQMPDYQHCAKKIRFVLERAEVSDKISEHMTIIITEMLS